MYKSVYYLALRIVKNLEDAEDMKWRATPQTTLYKPHIREFLMEQKEFNSSLIPFEELQAESDLRELAQYKIENQKLKSTIVTLMDKIERLENQLEQEKSKHKAEKLKIMENRGRLIYEHNRNRII